MIDYKQVKEKLLADPEVLKEYEAQKTEFAIARALIEARLAAKMTQAEVAASMHTSQAHISRMESGNHLPSLSSIHKYAQALKHPINIEIRP